MKSSYLLEIINLVTDGSKSCQIAEPMYFAESTDSILHLCWLLVAFKVAWAGYWPRTAQGSIWQPSVASPISEPEPHHLLLSFHVITFHFLSSLRWERRPDILRDQAGILASIFDLELKFLKIAMDSLELIHYSIRSEQIYFGE